MGHQWALSSLLVNGKAGSQRALYRSIQPRLEMPEALEWFVFHCRDYELNGFAVVAQIVELATGEFAEGHDVNLVRFVTPSWNRPAVTGEFGAFCVRSLGAALTGQSQEADYLTEWGRSGIKSAPHNGYLAVG